MASKANKTKSVVEDQKMQISVTAFRLNESQINALQKAARDVADVEAKIVEVTLQLCREREQRAALRFEVAAQVAAAHGVDLSQGKWQFDLDRKLLIQVGMPDQK